MDWKELIDRERYPDLWLPLLNLLKERGETFTYNEISELWGREKGNIYTKIDGWRGFAPELIHIDESVTPHEIHFIWDNLPYAEPPEVEVEEETDFPDFLAQRTVRQINKRLEEHDIIGEEYELEYERGNRWDINTQRGQLIVYIIKKGRRLTRVTGLFDNGIIVAPLLIQSVKEKWN